ncbi:MAG: DUF3021 domain-containing protein [Ruminococcaceae bacterium]|nr:DUF3021 domain-containing protein [Oscillospiraceae bacterium]
MMKNNYVKKFFLRGMMFGGFGPIICSIVYLILQFIIDDFTLSGADVFTSIVSTYILAFIHAGASVFNQIEHWPIAKSLFVHFLSLYVSYSLCYIINSWIPFEPAVLLIFTLIFVVVYFIVWITVFVCIKTLGNRLNKSLK